LISVPSHAQPAAYAKHMTVPGPGAPKQAPLAEQPSAVLKPQILPAPQSASVVQVPLPPPLLLPAPLLLLVVPPPLPPLLLVLFPPLLLMVPPLLPPLLLVPPLLPVVPLLLLVLFPPPLLLLPRPPSGVSMVVMPPEQPATMPVAHIARTAPIRDCK
jgi:hypothetical protein